MATQEQFNALLRELDSDNDEVSISEGALDMALAPSEGPMSIAAPEDDA